MEIKVSEHTQKAIQRQLASGQFSSPEDVVRTAIEQFDEHSSAVADIKASFADEEAGRVHALRDVDVEMREKYGFGRPS